MKYLKNLMMVLGISFLFSCVFAIDGFASRPFNIAVIHDCTSGLGTSMLDDIKKEVLSLTKGEFNVQFPQKFNITSGCSEKEIQRQIDQMLTNSNVDMILTLDPLASQILGKYKTLNKPCIAGNIFNPEFQGVSFKNGKSGISNLTYVVLSPNLIENINQFKELTEFKSVAFLIDEPIFKSLVPGQTFIQNIENETKTKFFFTPLTQNLDAVKETLNQTFDAIFIDYSTQMGNAGISDLISYINKKKIPSFSFHNRQLVEKGMLAGFDRSDEMRRYSRRIGILTQRILLNENPKDFKVAFSWKDSLLVNMKTAQSIGISPSFSVLTKAELINNESLVTSQLQTKNSSRDAISLSTLVTADESQLSKTALGLNETQTSFSLREAVDLSLKNNLILKSRAKETEAGKMNVKDALSKFYPQLGTGLNWTAIDDEHTSAISGVAERSWDISARVSQLIYSDQIYTNLKTSRHLQTIQELSEHQEKLDVILDTGIAYLDMLKARASARIQLDNLKLIRSNLVLANNRYKAGSSSPSDVYRLESEAAIANSNFLKSLAVVGKARIRLNQILNLDQEDNTRIQDIRLDDGQFIISDPKMRSIIKINNPRDFRKFRDFVVKKGLGASPEIKALDEQIIIQEDAYSLAKRSYWSPNVSVNGRVGNIFSKDGDGSDLDSSGIPSSLSSVLTQPDDTSWTVSLNIDIPFYEGGAKSAAKIKALETKSQIRFFKYNIQNLISENIRASLIDVSASLPAIDLTRLSADSAKKNLDLIQDAYSQGAVSIVNFLDAQNAALVANTFAENAVYDFFVDFMISERAAGNYSLFMDKDQRAQWIQQFQK